MFLSGASKRIDLKWLICICWWWYVCVRRRGPSITHYTGSRAVWLDENEDIDIRWLIFTTQQVWGEETRLDDDAEILLLLIYSPTDWILTHSEAPDLIDWSRPWTTPRTCLPEMIVSHHSRPLIGLLIIFQMGPHDLTLLLPGDILGFPYSFNLPDPSVWAWWKQFNWKELCHIYYKHTHTCPHNELKKQPPPVHYPHSWFAFSTRTAVDASKKPSLGRGVAE